MDTEIIATLIHKNEEIIKENEEIRKENEEIRSEYEEIRKENKEIRKENEEIRSEYDKLQQRLLEEEEISILLSKRIKIVEQDFCRYVEKMRLYLSYTKESRNSEYISDNKFTNEYENDEILYEKPQLSRSTNLHEWTHDDNYPLEI